MDAKTSKLNEGVKYDDGKIRMDLVSPYALFELCQVYTYGIREYTDHNWRKGIKWSRIIAAVFRHLFSFLMGEWADAESGLPHLAHAAWGCFTLLEYSVTHREFDDRYKFDKKDIQEMFRKLNKRDDIIEKPKKPDGFSFSLGGSENMGDPVYVPCESEKEEK